MNKLSTELMTSSTAFIELNIGISDTINKLYKKADLVKIVNVHDDVFKIILQIINKNKTIKTNNHKFTLSKIKPAVKDVPLFALYGTTDYTFDTSYNPKYEVNSIDEGIFVLEYYKDEKKNELILFARGSTDYRNDYIISEDVQREDIINVINEFIDNNYGADITNGVYTLKKNHATGKYYYEDKKKSISAVPTISPAKKILEDDINYFFSNVEDFSIFGKPPTRKTLLAGPQGTGKTTLTYEITREYDSKIPVAFCTRIDEAMHHIKYMARSNTPSIIIIEDAEATLSITDTIEASTVLNFLDGIMMPMNLGGLYIIMTTNHPEKIENRIKKRPGRIDKIIPVLPLNGDDAVNCTKLYMNAVFEHKAKERITRTDILNVFNNLTGSQIQDIVIATRIRTHSKTIPDIKEFIETKRTIQESLQSLNTLQDNFKENLDEKSKLGFQ